MADEPGSNDHPRGDHGGARPGAGRPKLTEQEKQARKDARKAAKATAKAAATAQNEQSQRTAASAELAKLPQLTQIITPETAQAIIAASKAMALREHRERPSPFQVAVHPPAATPPKELQMAMDENLSWAEGQWASNVVTTIGAEGLLFPGFPYLAALAQRPEYRVMSETIATEMTRKWIKFKGKGSSEEAKKKSDRIKELTDLFEVLEVRDRFKDLATEDGLFGRSHVFIDLGVDLDGAGDDELKKPIGQGTNKMSLGKIAKGALKRLQPVEAVWVYPTYYNATNPLKGDWYKPQHWYVMGKEVHHSRLLTFVGRQVPDLLKPAYSFGGLSLSQLAKPYVDIWLQTRASVGALIHSFSVMVLATDMQTVLSGGGAGSLMNRIAIFNALRDNQKTFAINKNTEDFKNVSAPLSGLEALQAQAQEHMMSVARIPAVKFTGIQPTGLNASSEGEIRAFYDTIGAYQNSLFRPNLTRIMHFAMLSLWGEIDEEIMFDFEPLWEMSEKERAELRKANAEAGQIHIDAGVLHPEEERRRIADDPDTLYPGMDVEDVPDLREEEEEGLEPAEGRPQPVAEEGPELGQRPDPKDPKGGQGRR